MELPQDLRTAVDEVLTSVSTRQLTALAADLSKRYRSDRSPGGGNFLNSQEDVAAYAAFRLPATYAAVYAALSQVQDRLPDWSPRSLLDVGAGPGTAMWAAAAIWPELQRITLLERDEGMISLGKRLAAHSSLPSVQEASWMKVDLTSSWNTPKHDVVIASYSLNELPQNRCEALISRLWENTEGTLIIIEPGTPAGFARIRQVREQLLAEGAVTTAPCPHDKECPLTGSDWCHFSQRIARSRLHRQVKAGDLSYEDEKFSFVCMSRLNSGVIPGRILRHPLIRKGHVQLEVCTPEGLTSRVVTRREKELYKKSRDLRWGSVMPAAEDKV